MELIKLWRFVMSKVTLSAHRGYRSKFPENTMLAFREALKLDIDSIEMDVRMTSDYHIVVMHDPRIDRTTDKKGQVCEMTLDQIREADAGIKFGEQFRGEKVPMFEEFLELMQTRPDIKVLLELKDYPEDYGDFAYASCEQALSLCKKYGVWGSERLVVITFSTAIAAWIKKKHVGEDIIVHGFYPKNVMKGSDKEDPYPYIDEVCIFSRAHTVDGRPTAPDSPVVDKRIFDNFAHMGIKPCVGASVVTEEHFAKALAHGALGFTCDDAYTAGVILDKLGARPFKKND